MKVIYLFLFSSLIAPFALQGAAEYKPSPAIMRIYKCYYSHNDIEQYSDTNNTILTPGTIVLVLTQPYIGEVALVTESVHQTADEVEVEFCGSHQTETVRRPSIRTFKPLFQLKMKPIPAPGTMHGVLESFILKLSTPGNSLPRAVAMLVPTTHRISVCGDLHGNVYSLASLIYAMHQEKIIDTDLKIAPGNLFVPLGDYGDRGNCCTEIWHHLALLDDINGSAIISLAGNHEDIDMARKYDFLNEWNTKLGPHVQDSHALLESLFASLPQALLVGFKHTQPPYYRFLLLLHGGIESEVNVVDLMIKIIQKSLQQTELPVLESLPIEQPSNRLPGYLWNDFVANEKEDSEPLISPSDRGSGVLAYNRAQAKFYMRLQRIDVPQEYSCRLDGVICAHVHYPWGLARLRNCVKNGNHWDTIAPEAMCTIVPGDVFTCNASNESCLLNVPSNAQGHFSTLSISSEGNWQITAH